MSEVTDIKLLVSAAAMMYTVIYGYRACVKHCCPVMNELINVYFTTYDDLAVRNRS